MKKASQKWKFTLEQISIGMGRIQHYEDDVQSFFAKFCNKSADKIEKVFLHPKTPKSYTIRSFKNHVIDNIRKEKKERKEYIGDVEFKSSYDIIDDIIIIKESIQIARNAVIKRYLDEKYTYIFDLMIAGTSPKDIIEITGDKNAGVIKCKIQKFLQNNRDILKI